MKRDTVINVLLIIVGIVLAIALFSAGVLWKSRAARSPMSFSSGTSSSQRELYRAIAR
jgi:FtsZ-interacting cell division protein ZipA